MKNKYSMKILSACVCGCRGGGPVCLVENYLANKGRRFGKYKIERKEKNAIYPLHLLTRSYINIIIHSVPLFTRISNVKKK